MKVYRYMSIEEFIKMSSGKTMKPQNEVFIDKATTSEGFCFLRESVSVLHSDIDSGNKTRTYGPDDYRKFLSGVVSDDVCVEFDVPDDTNFKVGTGTYRDPETEGEMTVEELSILEYSTENFKPVRCMLKGKEEWQRYDDVKNVEYREFLDGLVSKDKPMRITPRNIKLLPQISGSGKNDAWMFSEIRTADSKSLVLTYGDPMEGTVKHKIEFKSDNPSDRKPVYNLVRNESEPEFWSQIYGRRSLEDVDIDMARSYLTYAALAAVYPDMTSKFKLRTNTIDTGYIYYEKLKVKGVDPRTPEFFISDLSMQKDEEGALEIFKNVSRNGDVKRVCLTDVLAKLERPKNANLIMDSVRGDTLYKVGDTTIKSIIENFADLQKHLSSEKDKSAISNEEIEQ